MTVAPQGPAFSLQEIPFSHSGSWFNFSPVIAEKTYADDVHLVSHQNGLHPILRLVPIAGDRQRQHATITATPALLTWNHHRGAITLAYESVDTVRVTGTGMDLLITAANPSLTPFSGPYFFRDPVDGAHIYTVYETGRRYRITVLSGHLTDVTGGQALGTTERGVVCTGDGQTWEIAIEEYDTARAPYRAEHSFDEVHKGAQTAFSAFVDSVAPWRDEQTPAAELAAYVLWSATVRPAGFLNRPGVLMSKHWMNKIWSWDHCFNALALAGGRPDLAWDQFQTPFDHQDPTGALPDSVTHSEILHNFVKPPIHGWTLRQLRRHLHLTPADLRQAYQRLADWTRFWLTHRRAPGSPLAHYQHGNDSGWDNATCFDPEPVIETADLAAFLVLQMEELADIAAELGLHHEAATWQHGSEQMYTDLIEHLWTGRRFRARSALTGDTWTSTSLLDLMPIVLGARLDPAIGDALAEGIRAHLTPHGLATELPTSPHYTADGYWRGPIWAPSTVLIEDGLRRAGHTELADDISNRFRALCEKSGFAENFDAQSGAGLRDRAYTWTASAYLVLAAAHQRRSGHHLG
ncbi:trehalase family glycosidase [Catellatospora citrea]|uniref:amylo-alpha-1,6-glucosidase n=1 Tax=Catellatospora citrea TaxID=53366 RepID=UPI0033F99365